MYFMNCKIEFQNVSGKENAPKTKQRKNVKKRIVKKTDTKIYYNNFKEEI